MIRAEERENRRANNLQRLSDFLTKDVPPVVAFVGQQGSGKSTLADALVTNCNYTRVSFADALREDVAELYGLTLEEMRTSKGVAMEKLGGATPRQILQRYGAFRRAEDSEHWVKRMDAKLQGPNLYVIDDLRYHNEEAMLRAHDTLIVRLDSGHAPIDDNHESERDVPNIIHDILLRAVDFGEGLWEVVGSGVDEDEGAAVVQATPASDLDMLYSMKGMLESYLEGR